MLEPAPRAEEAVASPAVASSDNAGSQLLPLSVASILALQRTAGNVAVTRFLARAAGGDTRFPYGTPNSAMQRLLQRDAPKESAGEGPDTGRAGPHAWDWTIDKLKFGERASVSLKFSFVPNEHKAVKDGKVEAAGGGVSASGGLGELKIGLENAGAKFAAAVAKGAVSAKLPIPGVTFELQAKALELTAEDDKEPDINALTLSFSVKGDITQWMFDYLKVPEAKRPKAKIIVSGEAKLAPSLADFARLRDMFKAKREMKASAEAIEASAKRANVVQKELKAAESRIQTLERELKQGYGKRQKAKYATRAAFDDAKALKRAELVEKRAAKAALMAEKKVLRKTLRTQSKILQKATGLMQRAAKGLKSKAGRAMGKLLARKGAQAVARFLAKAIPIVNVIAIAWDLAELAVALHRIWNGAKLGGGGNGDGGGAADAGSEGAGPGNDSPAPDAGAGPDAGTTGSDAANTAPDAGNTDEDASAPAEPAKTALNPNAKRFADVMKGRLKLDADMQHHLEIAVPGTLRPDQLAELIRRMKRPGAGIDDPYEAIGMIHEEAVKILRGDKPETDETRVNGVRRPDLDEPPAAADATKAQADANKKAPSGAKAGAKPRQARDPNFALVDDPHLYLKVDPATKQLVRDQSAIDKAKGKRVTVDNVTFAIEDVSISAAASQNPDHQTLDVTIVCRVIKALPAGKAADELRAGDEVEYQHWAIYDGSTGRRMTITVFAGTLVPR